MKRIFIFTTLIIIVFTGCKKEQGCTNIQACNFSNSAEEDDGSCVIVGDECNDNNDLTFLDVILPNCECIGDSSVFGCTDEDACNFWPNANTDDGSCEYTTCLGCTDSQACNYNSESTQDDGGCVYIGDACDDLNTYTSNDIYNEFCNCEGLNNNQCYITTNNSSQTSHIMMELNLMTDDNPDTYFSLRRQDDLTVVLWDYPDQLTTPFTLYSIEFEVALSTQDISSAALPVRLNVNEEWNIFNGGYCSVTCVTEAGNQIVMLDETQLYMQESDQWPGVQINLEFTIEPF